MSFDALCNQSMSFHSNRFGGTLVSQTSKFMSAYQQLIETIMFPFLPVMCSVIFTCGIWRPRAGVCGYSHGAARGCMPRFVHIMYKRILSLNEKAASAQNQLSGELSDSVSNILAVKTYGREDYERGLFDAANREVVARDSKAHVGLAYARHYHGIDYRGHYERGGCIHRGRQCVVWHHAGHACDDVHLYLYGHKPVQFHQQRSAAFQSRVRRCERHDGHARRAATGGRCCRRARFAGA